jgi:hypothetical protein
MNDDRRNEYMKNGGKRELISLVVSFHGMQNGYRIEYLAFLFDLLPLRAMLWILL